MGISSIINCFYFVENEVKYEFISKIIINPFLYLPGYKLVFVSLYTQLSNNALQISHLRSVHDRT